MLNTRDVARDLLNGYLDVSDLVDNIQFLKDVDNSILRLVKEEDAWSDLVVARKRKLLMNKIEKLSSKEVDSDDE